MTLSSAVRSPLVLLSVAALAAGVGVVAPLANEARAVTPCAVKITAFSLDSSQRFAQGGRIKRYQASVDYPDGTAYDQTAQFEVGNFPTGAFPTLLSAPIGSRIKTGDMVKAQEPLALGAINGDFYRTPAIPSSNGTSPRVPIARGPMVKDGVVLHSDRGRARVVGVDENLQPFAGMMGIVGKVQSGTSPDVKIQGINWNPVQGGGVTVYTPEWKVTTATPRPAGVAEWVINKRNKIIQIRTSASNASQRGAAVATGTRVLAFSSSAATIASRGVVGERARVKIKQTTSTGVPLLNAIGRGLPLVENGVVAPLGCDRYLSKDARPRTFVGWNKVGKWRSFTVPGKFFSGQFRDGGFGLANAAKLARRAGLYNAYELDGGGSTTFYTRNNAGKWKRRDLYGLNTATGTYEREVTTGLAFVKPAP